MKTLLAIFLLTLGINAFADSNSNNSADEGYGMTQTQQYQTDMQNTTDPKDGFAS